MDMTSSDSVLIRTVHHSSRITPSSVILSEAQNPDIFSRSLSFQIRGFSASLRMTGSKVIVKRNGDEESRHPQQPPLSASDGPERVG